MNFIYLDPGLINFAGHHAAFCRNLVNALDRRGHTASIYSNVAVAKNVQHELKAMPLFRANPYNQYVPQYETAPDPICGWLKSFEVVWQSTAQDLGQLRLPTQDDVIYWNSAFPAQLTALAHWLGSLPEDRRPHAVVELNLDSGVIDDGKGGFELPNPQVNEKPLLWRYAGMLLSDPKIRNRIKLINFESSTVPGYEYLLREPVEAWNPPFCASANVESRVGKQGFAIGILGYQREEKGFTLVPELAKRLLSERQDIALLVHNAEPAFMWRTQSELREIAARESRLVLIEGAIPDRWMETVNSCDLIVCPYDPAAFKTRCSGMLNESLANGIPVIVPANTSLARVFEEFGAPGAVFEKWTVESIAASVFSVLNNYDEHAQRAFEAAEKWEKEYSVEGLASNILGWIEEARKQHAFAGI
ncbi:MAG TPA: glycosyltransferase [Bryobacteraceae bacterium]|nr:glycosyltransferase [Bryobacteraceae bacterium]